MVSHSAVFQILLQIVVSESSPDADTTFMASPPAWTKPAGILSTPADFPILSTLIAASTSSRRIG